MNKMLHVFLYLDEDNEIWQIITISWFDWGVEKWEREV